MDGTVSLGKPMLVPVCDATGIVVAMLQVPENLPLPSVSADILKGKAGRTCRQCWKTVRLRITWRKVSNGLTKRVVTLQRKSYPQKMKGKKSLSLTQSLKGLVSKQC